MSLTLTRKNSLIAGEGSNKEVIFDTNDSLSTLTEHSSVNETVLIADTDKVLLPALIASVKYVKLVSDGEITVKVNTETILACTYLEIRGTITALTASGGVADAKVKVYAAG
jgi:hypothetical protein